MNLAPAAAVKNIKNAVGTANKPIAFHWDNKHITVCKKCTAFKNRSYRPGAALDRSRDHWCRPARRRRANSLKHIPRHRGRKA